ncbi:hypothetical protein [Paramaledivibacter caminithermalis]|jgi:mannose/fructose/N-acetylgalactosamine-specific phosphotransferase system component IIC|uniref:Uncharacterized protein n=1 Tax=Paramaledivibacter caminithermalis (strain DSM 15212 / CIP 107654 / DViRD3) TaxID=1121301 RepID=A0A1M6PEA6_PARC5|nr:hypothetical protein [Paramaledivibacter caminithermalis]SHK06283.1 hypothetical protein SAMN02745912_02132 [Paramaledivibacter caminithermalis DSM 15212]
MKAKTRNELGFMMYCTISQRIDKAIENNNISEIDMLEEMIDYYSANFVISAAHLREKLEILKGVK